MDRPPPPRRPRPAPAPPFRGGRRRNLPARTVSPAAAPRSQPSPSRPAPSPSARPRSKNRRRRGNPPYNPSPSSLAPSAVAPARPPPPSVAVKLIVRRLPPTLTAPAFAAAADPAGAAAAIWRSFVPGSASAPSGAVKRMRHVTRHAVAYLGFPTLDGARAFSDAFNGNRFQDPDPLQGSQPQEFVARVERAPWQAVPQLGRRVRPSPLQGTIESDPDYIAFVQRLEEEAKREISGTGALTVAQTNAMFPAKGPAAASASQAGTEKGDIANGGVVTARGKVGALPVKGSGLVTPLMEDVRARRKERDQKKKSTKAAARAPRTKGRQIVVLDPATKHQGEQPGKGSASTSRRKKQRERARAAEIANAGKAQEEAQPQKRVNGKAPVNGRRGGGGGPRRDDVEPRTNGHLHANPRGNPQQRAASGSDAIAFGGNGKGSGPRGGPGRSRSGRGGRSKAKSNGHKT